MTAPSDNTKQAAAAPIPDHLADVWVHPLPEVAVIANMNWRYLADKCRDNTLEHVRQGAMRGMNRHQIRVLIERHSPGGDLSAAQKVPTSLDAAREMSRAGGAKRSGRRVA